jgi:hypothetical protein
MGKEGVFYVENQALETENFNIAPAFGLVQYFSGPIKTIFS